MANNVAILSFNNGEVSPLMDARSDVDKYASSCRILENMLPLIYGGVTRRPGTEYVATAKSSATAIRLIPFIFSSTIAYMCEFGDLYIRFYFDGAVLESGGSPVEVTTTYLAADLPQLQFAQVGDTMWITHPDYAPRKLTRTSVISFSLDTITFTQGPFLPRNDIEKADSVTMQSSVTTKGDTGILTASADTFQAGHVGALFKLFQPRDPTSIETSCDAALLTGTAIGIKGSFSLTVRGDMAGSIVMERRDNESDWEIYRTYRVTAAVPSVSEAYEETEDGIEFRTRTVSRTAGSSTAVLSTHQTTREGIVRVDSYVSNTVVNITVLAEVETTDATLRWSEGAWSDVRGYPATITFFEDRAIYAGSTFQPQVIWLSETGDYENFAEGFIADDDSFNLTLATTNDIRWIAPLEAIVEGTAKSVWSLSSSKQYEPLTPTNFAAREQTTPGTSNIPPIRSGKALLAVDYSGRKIHELSYSYSEDRYLSPDMTALAEHITEGGIVAIAYQQTPESIVWCVRGDGVLLSLTHDRQQNIIAWARHPLRTGDTVESVAVIPGDEEDEVWVSTIRSIDSSDVRYIERMKPRTFSSQEDAFFVDSGLTYDGAATSTLSNLDHLEGELVQILGNGAVFPEKIVLDGQITLDETVTKAHVGLAYRYTVKPMRLDVSKNGTSKGSYKKITELVLSLYQALGMEYGEDTDHLFPIDWRSDEVYGSPPNLFTGDKIVVLDAGFNVEDPIVISGNTPLPCTLRAIIVRLEVVGR